MTQPGATRKLIVKTKVTRLLVRLSLFILGSIWKWVFQLNHSKKQKNIVHYMYTCIHQFLFLGQTTTTFGGWKWCENPCQCWHQEGSLYQWGGRTIAFFGALWDPTIVWLWALRLCQSVFVFIIWVPVSVWNNLGFIWSCMINSW